MQKFCLLSLPWVMFLTTASAWGQNPYQHRNNGLALGALLGGVTGGLIGDRNDETLAGAAIGAAVGGLTGAVVGNSVDQEMAYRETRAGQRVLVQQTAGAVTVADVIAMTQSRLSDPIIITQIQTRGVAQRLQAPDLITLSNAGVSEAVIQAMQTAPLPSVAAPVPAVVPVYREPVVVEHYVVPPYPRPVYFYGRPHYYHRMPPPRPHRPGVSVGFSFSN